MELVRQFRGEHAITARYPWAIAFTFVVARIGVRRAAEVGLPRDAVATCLFLFNVGVEIGQLLFIAAVFGSIWIYKRTFAVTPLWSRWFPPCAIGSFAAFWFLQRSLLVLGATTGETTTGSRLIVALLALSVAACSRSRRRRACSRKSKPHRRRS